MSSNGKDKINDDKSKDRNSSRSKSGGKIKNKPRNLRIQRVNKLLSVPKCDGCERNIRRTKLSCNGEHWEVVTEQGQHYCIDCLEYFERKDKWKIFELVRKNKEMDDQTKEDFSEIMQIMEDFPEFSNKN